MNVSIREIMNTSDYAAQRAVREELLAMNVEIKRRMDAGVSPEEFKALQKANEAAQAAERILEKLFS